MDLSVGQGRSAWPSDEIGSDRDIYLTSSGGGPQKLGALIRCRFHPREGLIRRGPR